MSEGVVQESAVYRHYKGDQYTIVSVAVDATNEREGNKVVVYRSLTNETTYCRDLEEFTETTEWPDGRMRPRFVKEDVEHAHLAK